MTTTLSIRRSRYTVDVDYTRSWNLSYDDVERGFTHLLCRRQQHPQRIQLLQQIDEPTSVPGQRELLRALGHRAGHHHAFHCRVTFHSGYCLDVNKDGQNTDRPILNGVMLQRNTFRNTGLKDISLRVQKNFVLPNEWGKLSLSAEFFNLANFANVQLAGAAFTYGLNATPLAAFGQLKNPQGQYDPYNVAGDPFQAQLGLRFAF